MTAGASVDFDVPFAPGPGRSSLVVSAKALFANAGPGVTVRDFPFGEESAAQRQDHSRCVRQDPDGILIRLLDCDEAAAEQARDAASRTIAGMKPVFHVPELLSTPPKAGEIVILVGHVVDTYLCPPCPKGAMCKPCAVPSSVYLAATAAHRGFALSAPAADVAVIFAADPTAFRPGAEVWIEIKAASRAESGCDGVLVGSE